MTEVGTDIILQRNMTQILFKHAHDLIDAEDESDDFTDSEDDEVDIPHIPPIPQLPQSEQFWISDGNVVLETSTLRYRVHRSLLCRHSTVFRAILTGGAAPDIVVGVEDDDFGCQRLLVQGSDKDWNILLSIFYHTARCATNDSGAV